MTAARHGPDHALVAVILDQVTTAPARLGHTRLVAVDGPAGSGKTTLAAALCREAIVRGLDTADFHLDDVYDGWDTDFDELATRVISQVLAPLTRAHPARWQRYDWTAGRFDGWQTLAAPDLLVLEGCGAGARNMTAYTSVLVWVEAARGTRIERGVARDGAQVLPDWLAWMDHEAAHFAAHETQERADIQIQT